MSSPPARSIARKSLTIHHLRQKKNVPFTTRHSVSLNKGKEEPAARSSAYLFSFEYFTRKPSAINILRLGYRPKSNFMNILAENRGGRV
jgi:hypothetical protein